MTKLGEFVKVYPEHPHHAFIDVKEAVAQGLERMIVAYIPERDTVGFNLIWGPGEPGRSGHKRRAKEN